MVRCLVERFGLNLAAYRFTSGTAAKRMVQKR